VVLALTTQSRQENALLKLISRERREMRAKLEGKKQAALEKAAKAGRAALHPPRRTTPMASWINCSTDITCTS
jgi:hypothetical protein